MQNTEIKILFKNFCGEKLYRKFIHALFHECARHSRLMFWQENLWNDFLNQYKIDEKIDVEQMLEIFRLDQPAPGWFSKERKIINEEKSIVKSILKISKMREKTAYTSDDRGAHLKSLQALIAIHETVEDALIDIKSLISYTKENLKHPDKPYRIYGDLSSDDLESIEACIKKYGQADDKIIAIDLRFMDHAIVTTETAETALANHAHNRSRFYVIRTLSGWEALKKLVFSTSQNCW